jgi:erythromycin esterase-like protein
MGRGDLSDAVVGSVFSWSQSVAYEENRALISWMREYNGRAATNRKVRFYGIDLTGGRQGRFLVTHPSIDAALAYIGCVDSADGRSFRERFSPFVRFFTSTGYDSLTPPQQNSLTAAITDLIALFQRRQVTWTAMSSAEAYDRAYHHAIILSQLDANFRAAKAESNPQAQREVSMAQNLLWVLEQEGMEGRIFLYEANWHLSKGPMFTDRWGSSLGEHLRTTLGKQYVPLGSVYGGGVSRSGEENQFSPPEASSAAALLSATGFARCVLSLTECPATGEVGAWFSAERPLQAGRNDNMSVAKAFDGLVFIDRVRPVPGPIPGMRFADRIRMRRR